MSRRRSNIAAWTFLAAIGVTGALEATAQNARDIVFEHIDSRAGLSHNSVYSTYQDRQGYIWFGTRDGLNRYDGYQFVTFRHDPTDTLTLSDKAVRAVGVDSQGFLWVGTESSLDRLDRLSGRFRRYLSEGINDLVLDGRARLWVATNQGSILRYDEGRDTLIAYHTYGEGRVFFHSLAIDTSGTPWIFGPEGQNVVLRQYNASRDRFERVLALDRVPGPRPVQILAGPSGTIWLAGVGGPAYSPAHPGVRTTPILPAGVIANRMIEDHEGFLWIGTDGDGLIRFDPVSGSTSSYRLDESPASWLNNNVQHLFLDRTGSLWVGTLGGVYRLDPQRKPFRHLGPDYGLMTDKSLRLVMSVFEDGQGFLWAGTLGNGLLRIDRANGTIRGYRSHGGRSGSLSRDLIWGIQEDSSGRLWVTSNLVIDILDRTRERFSRLDVGVYQLTPEIDGMMWAAHGALVYQIETRSRRVARTMPFPSRSRSEEHSISVDRSGTVWVGEDGLYRCVPEAATCEVFEAAEQDRVGLREGSIWSIHEDAENTGILWVGTDNGLFSVDIGAPHFTRVLGTRELPGSAIYSILEDDLHRLWMGTSRGLVRFDKQTGAVRVFDAGDGVLNSEFNRRAAFRSARGEFFFGGLDGITSFFPEDIHDNPHTPPIAITYLQKSNQRGVIVLNPGEATRDGLLLNPGDHSFTFEFAALNFTSPNMNRYSFMLQGFDRDWVESGTRRVARYVGVPPGRYTFRVRGSNNDGLWNEKGIAMAVTILPPFWQTTWFRLLVIGAVLVSLYGAHRYRVRRLLEVEHLRFRIASDLHDDIGSKLSSVALIGEMVTQRAALDERERRQLTEMSHVARKMVDDLRDIVWMVNPGYDTVDNLISKMQETADAMLNGTSHTFRLPVDGISADLDMERRRHLFLMYRETLHNVVRHAHATHVDIHLEQNDGTLIVRVRDNGSGFDAASVTRHSGLQNLEERARLIGGGIVVESHPGAGTSVRITAPVK